MVIIDIKRYVFLFLSAFAFFLLSADSSAAEDISEGCKRCHEDVYKKALASPYQHKVAIDNCAVCHLSDPAGKSDDIEIMSHTFNKEEIFPLKKLRSDSEYRVEIVAIDSDDRKSAPSILAIKPPDINEWAISQQIEVSGLKIHKIEQGIFASASLFWRTDIPGTTEIEYGLTKDFENRLTVDDHYTREHRISMNGLEGDKRYYFRVISRDVHGNVARSERNTLDTSQVFSGKADVIGITDSAPIIDHAEVFKVEKRGFYITISLNKPCRILLKISEKAKVEEKFVHFVPSKRDSAITACIRCHGQGETHPVGVRAKNPDTITPDDLPTIEGGILTCVTCHDPHGSDKQFLARVEFNTKICIKCHISEFFI